MEKTITIHVEVDDQGAVREIQNLAQAEGRLTGTAQEITTAEKQVTLAREQTTQATKRSANAMVEAEQRARGYYNTHKELYGDVAMASEQVTKQMERMIKEQASSGMAEKAILVRTMLDSMDQGLHRWSNSTKDMILDLTKLGLTLMALGGTVSKFIGLGRVMVGVFANIARAAGMTGVMRAAAASMVSFASTARDSDAAWARITRGVGGTILNLTGLRTVLGAATTGVRTFGIAAGALAFISSPVGLITGLAAIWTILKGIPDAIKYLNEVAIPSYANLESSMTSLAVVSDRLGKSMSGNMDVINRFDDGITDPEAIASTVRMFHTMNVPLERQIQLISQMRDGLIAMGMDVNSNLPLMARAMKQGNSELLDNMGVVSNIENMYKDYARTIGLTADKLTQQQREEAIIQGVLKETAIYTGSATKALDTYNGKMGKLETTNKKIAQTFGELVMPWENFKLSIAQGVADLELGFLNWAKSMREAWNEMQKFNNPADPSTWTAGGRWGNSQPTPPPKDEPTPQEPDGLPYMPDRFKDLPHTILLSELIDAANRGLPMAKSFMELSKQATTPDPETQKRWDELQKKIDEESSVIGKDSYQKDRIEENRLFSERFTALQGNYALLQKEKARHVARLREIDAEEAKDRAQKAEKDRKQDEAERKRREAEQKRQLDALADKYQRLPFIEKTLDRRQALNSAFKGGKQGDIAALDNAIRDALDPAKNKAADEKILAEGLKKKLPKDKILELLKARWKEIKEKVDEWNIEKGGLEIDLGIEDTNDMMSAFTEAAERATSQAEYKGRVNATWKNGERQVDKSSVIREQIEKLEALKRDLEVAEPLYKDDRFDEQKKAQLWAWEMQLGNWRLDLEDELNKKRTDGASKAMAIIQAAHNVISQDLSTASGQKNATNTILDTTGSLVGLPAGLFALARSIVDIAIDTIGTGTNNENFHSTTWAEEGGKQFDNFAESIKGMGVQTDSQTQKLRDQINASKEMLDAQKRELNARLDLIDQMENQKRIDEEQKNWTQLIQDTQGALEDKQLELDVAQKRVTPEEAARIQHEREMQKGLDEIMEKVNTRIAPDSVAQQLGNPIKYYFEQYGEEKTLEVFGQTALPLINYLKQMAIQNQIDAANAANQAQTGATPDNPMYVVDVTPKDDFNWTTRESFYRSQAPGTRRDWRERAANARRAG